MIRTLIVDDEESCRELLRIFIDENCKDVDIVGMAESIDEAYEQITLKKPDLVFLDISMPPSDGFELLKRFKEIPFQFVFTTAHNQYILNAIRVSAADYLLKPVNPVELIQAVNTVKKKIEAGRIHKIPHKIVFNTKDALLFVQPLDIIRIEMLDRNVNIILKSNKTVEIVGSLNEIEEQLKNYAFMRSHRSHIINLNEIMEYVPDRHGGCVVMSDKKLVPVAERRREEFLRIFGI